MRGEDDDAVGIAAAFLDRHHIHHLSWRGDARAGDALRGGNNVEAAAAILTDRCKTRLGPAPGGADAVRIGLCFGQGVAAAKAHQGLDRRMHLVGADRGGDFAQHRVLVRRRRSLLRSHGASATKGGGQGNGKGMQSRIHVGKGQGQ